MLIQLKTNKSGNEFFCFSAKHVTKKLITEPKKLINLQKLTKYADIEILQLVRYKKILTEYNAKKIKGLNFSKKVLFKRGFSF